MWVDVGTQSHGGAGTQSLTVASSWHGRALLLQQGEGGGEKKPQVGDHLPLHSCCSHSAMK